MRITQRSVAKLVPYAQNARTHSEAQVAQLMASIEEFGWTNPVLVDGDNGIIAGHGRVMAALKLGQTKVPCIEIAHLTEEQRRAYIIADNRLAESAGWDKPVLALELAELTAADFDASLIGFDPADLDSLLAFVPPTDGLTDPDAVPDEQERLVSAPGALWRLGRHRLLCGDATDEAHVRRALADSSPHLMVTDPPYGVGYDADWRNRADMAGGIPPGGRAIGEVKNDDRVDWREAWALFAGDVVYCWHASWYTNIAQTSLEDAGFDIRTSIIWNKSRFVISRGHYHWKHEPCWYAVRKGRPGHWQGDRSQTTVWDIDHRKSETGHSTQKPVECMRRPIENNSAPGDAIYDPFVGGGTTIIAAEMTGRTCLAIDIDPIYVDVAVRRWQDFTGEAATLDGDGRTFDQIAQERREAA